MTCHGYIGCRLSAYGIAKKAADQLPDWPGCTEDIVEWEPGNFGLMIHYDTNQGAPPPEDIIEDLQNLGIFKQIVHWPTKHTGSTT